MQVDWEPVTIGNVTVLHPGGKPPEEWPSRYPGPGYTAEVVYKGRKYGYLFKAEQDSLNVEMTFPDGSQHLYKSPNAASDSMVLFDRGLPLDASAYVKKHTYKLSYPATKALKLRDFAPHFLNLDLRRPTEPKDIMDAKEGSFIELEMGKRKLLFVKRPDTWIATAFFEGEEVQDRVPMDADTVNQYLDRTEAEKGKVRVRLL